MASDVGRPVDWDTVAARLSLMAMDANATGTLRSMERAATVVKRRMTSLRKSGFTPQEVISALEEWEEKSKWFPAYSDLAVIMKKRRAHEEYLRRMEARERRQLEERRKAEEWERKYRTPEIRERISRGLKELCKRLETENLRRREEMMGERITDKYNPDPHAPPSRELKEIAASLGLDVRMEDD